MRRLAKWCFAHRTIVVLTWLGMLASVNVIHAGAGSAYNDNFKLPHTESFDAIRLLQRNAPKASGDTEQIVIAVARGRVTDRAARTRVDALLARVAAAPHVSIVSSPFRARGRRPDRAVWPGRVRKRHVRRSVEQGLGRGGEAVRLDGHIDDGRRSPVRARRADRGRR